MSSFCKRIKNPQGDVIGIWVANPNDSDLKARVEEFNTSEGLPVELLTAFHEGQYRIVPNRLDQNGGAFLMFGGSLVPGELSNEEELKLSDPITPSWRKSYARASKGDWVFTVLVPGFGIIIGLRALFRGESKRGLTMIIVGAVTISLLLLIHSAMD
jgi:hypothetical protein